MRHPEWILAVVVLASILAPLAAGAQDAELADYAQRETIELEGFAGGHAGVVVLIVVIVAVIVLVSVILPW
ncbi:MAG TPA: hypothetical protein VF950_02900 [Planctomycetota bacterium]